MPARISETLDAWRDRGRFLSVFEQRIFVVDVGPRDAEALVLLHGFPTSSLDFHRVIDRLAERFRVVAHDHPGFGLSAKPEHYSYSLLEQAETAVEVWRQLGIDTAHLLAHDYGTSVATELLARRRRGLLPFTPRSVTLSNGSIHLELARLRLSQRIARSRTFGPLFSRLVTGAYFRNVMRRLWGDPSRAEAADLEAMWQGVRAGEGQLRTHQISSYLDERMRFWHRWIEALETLDLPTHVLWGRRDPVAVPAIAEQLAREIPGAELTWLDGLGHYPQLEDPERWAAAVLGFLERLQASGNPERDSLE